MRCSRRIIEYLVEAFECDMPVTRSCEWQAALQPSALTPTAPSLSLTDFSRAPQELPTDDL